MCLHRDALRDASLLKDFGAIFFCSKLVSHFLYLALHGVFSALILHSVASDRDYFKASYNGLLIYLAKMRKLALHWPLAS